MGAPIAPIRVICDTNVLLSALVFGSRLSWLRRSWSAATLPPLVCPETVRELVRALGYPKFGLSEQDREELLGDYLPFAEIVEVDDSMSAVVRCRDTQDQIFIDLATAAEADMFITTHADLLVLADAVPFRILRPVHARELACSDE